MKRQIRPTLTRPPDFESFWANTCEELNAIDPEVRRTPVTCESHPLLELSQLTFHSLGGVEVTGYSLGWMDDASRPLVVHSHGYGSHCDIQWKWAEAGYNVAGIDIRGFGRSATAVPAPSRWGYVLTGIESPETCVLRGAVCDYGRSMQLARDLFAGRTARRLTYGFSLSGGLALMAEALWNTSDLLVLGVPTFGWAEGRYFLVKSGSGAEIAHYLEERPEATEDVMLVLRYFDAVNFAGMVSCETLIGLGLNDPVVPAETVYSIANHFTARCEIMEFPVSHTALPEEQRWEEFESRWLALGRGESELRPLRMAKSRRKKPSGWLNDENRPL
jgi:Acetyl esterase (deacetylase)